MGTGDSCSVAHSICNFSAEKAKKLGKDSELCDSEPNLVKFQRSNTLMSDQYNRFNLI